MLFDDALAISVTRNVKKVNASKPFRWEITSLQTAKLYLVRSEAMQATDKSATQVGAAYFVEYDSTYSLSLSLSLGIRQVVRCNASQHQSC